MAGRCWTELNRPLRAVPLLEEALSRYPDEYARDKALYLTWLARAYMTAGEVEQAAVVTGRALDLAADVVSVRPRQRLNPLLAALRPHWSIPEVQAVMVKAAA